MVFNRKLTPRAEIASAVTASASIPLAFTPMHFITAAPDTGTLAERKPLSRVVADGGIAANYPAFVFTDKGFRKYVGLESDHETNPVVGFLLDEEPDQRRAVLDLYRRGQFAGTLDEIIEAATTTSSSAWPKVPRFRRRVQPRSGIGAIVNRAWELLDQALYVLELPLLTALSVLGGLVDRPAFWKWPSPANRHVRLWMSALRPWIATSPVPLVLGVTAFTLMFSIGSLWWPAGSSWRQVGSLHQFVLIDGPTFTTYTARSSRSRCSWWQWRRWCSPGGSSCSAWAASDCCACSIRHSAGWGILSFERSFKRRPHHPGPAAERTKPSCGSKCQRASRPWVPVPMSISMQHSLRPIIRHLRRSTLPPGLTAGRDPQEL